jgi:hypothetical protein
MAIHTRHTLLMLAVLLGVTVPSGRPPGRKKVKVEPRPAEVPATDPCPYPDCSQGKGHWRKKLLYVCDSCNRVSYYCVNCRSLYPPDEEVHHDHKAPAV